MRKRVLFVGSFNAPRDGKIGGQYFACRSLMDSDIKNDFDFILIDSTLDSIHVKSVFFRLNKIIKRIFKFGYNLLFKKIDIVLVFSSSGLSFIEKGFMAIVGKITGKQVILVPRSGNILEDIRRPLFVSYIKLVFSLCDRVICQSEYWRSVFTNLAPTVDASKFVVLENWLPDKYFQAKAIKSYSLSQPLKILYFNRIEIDKGIFDFLKAMKLVASKGIMVQADIFGDGRQIEQVKEYIHQHQLDNTTFKGWLKDDKERVISQYDLYVFTSFREGFPNALLEVMALGVPIISTNVGAVNDLIDHTESGFIVNVNSPAEIANYVEEINRNRELITVFSRRAMERVATRNKMSYAIQEFKNILTHV